VVLITSRRLGTQSRKERRQIVNERTTEIEPTTRAVWKKTTCRGCPLWNTILLRDL